MLALRLAPAGTEDRGPKEALRTEYRGPRTTRVLLFYRTRRADTYLRLPVRRVQSLDAHDPPDTGACTKRPSSIAMPTCASSRRSLEEHEIAGREDRVDRSAGLRGTARRPCAGARPRAGRRTGRAHCSRSRFPADSRRRCRGRLAARAPPARPTRPATSTHDYSRQQAPLSARSRETARVARGRSTSHTRPRSRPRARSRHTRFACTSPCWSYRRRP